MTPLMVVGIAAALAIGAGFIAVACALGKVKRRLEATETAGGGGAAPRRYLW